MRTGPFLPGGPGESTVLKWVKGADFQQIVTNDCGSPGRAGFPLGVCPEANLPAGMTALYGHTDKTHNNYGNYRFSDGSICCYYPRSWVKIGSGESINGLPANIPNILPDKAFASEIVANAAGYFRPPIFKDGGETKLGVFVDKFMCSKNAWGTGYIASSLPLGAPISSHADHNPVADLTACSSNAYYQFINAAKARDGVDGAINEDSIWFVEPRMMQVYDAICSLAHGYYSTGTTYCAWYDSGGTTNYPKGCNNNALGDTDDSAVEYTSDGYSNCGLTGSGVPFAKTTSNGQACGVADRNGLMWEVALGVTCVASSVSITAASQAAECQLEVVGHGQTGSGPVMITGMDTGMTELDDRIFTYTVVDADNITINVDSSAFAAYDAGGTATFGTFYRKKDSVRYQDFTAGNSSDTDHWGAAGVAAMMEEFDMTFETVYPGNGFSQRMGSGANQVLSTDISGNGAVLTSLGIPQDADGIDTSGTNLFGRDYFYQYIRNELCVLSGGAWNSGSYAGVWYSYWHYYRTYSTTLVGFRCACYPV